jgi:hypothetical protein
MRVAEGDSEVMNSRENCSGHQSDNNGDKTENDANGPANSVVAGRPMDKAVTMILGHKNAPP